MTIKLADGLPFHPTLRHPRTGDRLRAIMIGRNGKPVWPVIGASEDDDSNNDDKSGDKSGADADDKSDGDDKGDKPEEKPKDGTADRIAKLEADIAQMRTHLSASDRKKTAAERELQALKDKDLPEVERLKKEAEDAKATNEKSAKVLRNLAVTNAFLLSSQKAKVNWHDADVSQQAALKLGGFEVDEDGNVTGMDEVVKKLAKDKAFLVDGGKPAKGDKEDKEEVKKNGPSGSGVGAGANKTNGKPGQLDKDELRRKYAALRN